MTINPARSNAARYDIPTKASPTLFASETHGGYTKRSASAPEEISGRPVKFV